MRTITALLLLLAASASCFGQEKMKVDIYSATARTVPEVTLATGMGQSSPHPASGFRVDFSASTTPHTGSMMLEIRIVNISATPRTLPVSQDGVKLVAKCPDHTVLTGNFSVGSKGNISYFLKVGSLYGCEASPPTVVQLKPGEWVSYVTKVATTRLPKEMRAEILLDHSRYRHGPSGQTSEGLGPVIFEYSPWVEVPEASAANK